MRCSLLLLLLACLCARADGYIIARWPLAQTLPVEDLSVDGTAQGPANVSMCVGMFGANACHDPDASCNQCRSQEPHIFHVTWCADTRGYRGISCDLDLGYRSAQGARNGHFAYSLRGRGSQPGDFINASSQVFPDSPFPFSHFAVDSGKNNILTVFQLSMAEGNDDGDDLALTDSQGFCCRATFSGGKTVTGTLYVGDLTIRGNALASATRSPSPSATAPPPAPAAAAAAGYSGSAVFGAVAGGGLLGAALTLGGFVLQHFRATGRAPAWASTTRYAANYARVDTGLLAASASGSRLTQLQAYH